MKEKVILPREIPSYTARTLIPILGKEFTDLYGEIKVQSETKTKQIENYISDKMGYDLSTFFDQYLRTTNIPVFEYKLNDGLLKYKWTNVVDGFKMPIELFVGDDRVKEFEKLVNKQNGKKAPHGFYEFDSINVISAGERDPDADGAEGMSASKMRDAAEKNDLIAFTSGLPKRFKDAEGLMNAVRKGMGLKEEKSFRQDIKLERVSMLRDKYVAGKLFNVNDDVVTLDGKEGIINKLGSNHVEVKLNGDGRFRNFWLSDICLNN